MDLLSGSTIPAFKRHVTVVMRSILLRDAASDRIPSSADRADKVDMFFATAVLALNQMCSSLAMDRILITLTLSPFF
jgi:hypothetical protein